MGNQEPEDDAALEGDEQEEMPWADVAWRAAITSLRTAARAGLPSPATRAHVQRELAGLLEWLAQVDEPAAIGQAPQPCLVEIRRLPRRKHFALQLRLDQQLWDALRQPDALQPTVVAGQVRLCPASRETGRPVRRHAEGPRLYCADAQLPGLVEGYYVAAVQAGAIVIGERLDLESP